MTAPHSTRGFADHASYLPPSGGRPDVSGFRPGTAGGHTKLSRILVLVAVPAAVAGHLGIQWLDDVLGPSSPEEVAEMYMAADLEGDFKAVWNLSCFNRHIFYEGSRWDYVLERTAERRETQDVFSLVDFRVGDVRRDGAERWEVTVEMSFGDKRGTDDLTVVMEGDEYRVC